MKYRCTYITGDSKENDGGIWEKKETLKIIIFTCIEKSFFAVDYDKFYCKKDNSGKHHITDWKDDTYTVYPNRCGTPHIFESIGENNENSK